MRFILAALVAWIAIIGVARAQPSAEQLRQKKVVRMDPRPHCQVDRGGHCYNGYTAQYLCIPRADCEHLRGMDHAWSWRTD